MQISVALLSLLHWQGENSISHGLFVLTHPSLGEMCALGGFVFSRIYWSCAVGRVGDLKMKRHPCKHENVAAKGQKNLFWNLKRARLVRTHLQEAIYSTTMFYYLCGNISKFGIFNLKCFSAQPCPGLTEEKVFTCHSRQLKEEVFGAF